jgi:hypothetical protein
MEEPHHIAFLLHCANERIDQLSGIAVFPRTPEEDNGLHAILSFLVYELNYYTGSLQAGSIGVHRARRRGSLNEKRGVRKRAAPLLVDL